MRFENQLVIDKKDLDQIIKKLCEEKNVEMVKYLVYREPQDHIIVQVKDKK